MKTEKILQSDFLDLLFDDRNKDYGAYQIRKGYNKRLRTSLLIITSFCLVLFLSSFVVSKKAKVTTLPPPVIDVTISKDHLDKPKPTVVLPKPKTQLIKVKIAAFTPPVITPDDRVITPPADQKSLSATQIGALDQPGDDGTIVAPPVNTGTNGGEISLKKTDLDSLYYSVQMEARFKGDWIKYLERTLNTEVPVENNAPSGNYTVIVSFVVDRNGNLSDVKALNDPGYGTAEEALRAINKTRTGLWEPATQNGNNVVYRQKQNITFVVQDQQ